MSKVDPERDRARKALREKCGRCGRPFAQHGATPPHTHGDDCPGFVATTEAR